MECAGSLGDLGTLLPLAIGMILINGLDPMGLFFAVGLFYIVTGIYYGVTVPIQPMKVVGAYAIATGMDVSQILASGALVAVFLFLIGGTGAITIIGKYTPKAVVRGVQLSTGVLLMSQGVRFMFGTSKFQLLRQAAEPFLKFQSLGPIPIGIIIGIIGIILTLTLLENRKLPAGLIVVLGGIAAGLLLGNHEGLNPLRLGIHLPKLFPFGFPSATDFTTAFILLVLPQIPMTLGNAVIAYADLSEQYFNEASKKVTYKSACISMALANFVSFIIGGMPLCHGAGGLAAHYRFGARTAGSNLIIGAVFVALAVFLGANALGIVSLIPMSVLGVLLLFAGSQLALTVIDLNVRKDLFVAVVMLGITLASNLAVGFIAGFAVAYALKSDRLTV
jgi:SulP family sulfate permease